MWHAERFICPTNLCEKSVTFKGIKHVRNKQSDIFDSMIHMRKAKEGRKTSNLLWKLHWKCAKVMQPDGAIE